MAFVVGGVSKLMNNEAERETLEDNEKVGRLFTNNSIELCRRFLFALDSPATPLTYSVSVFRPVPNRTSSFVVRIVSSRQNRL